VPLKAPNPLMGPIILFALPSRAKYYTKIPIILYNSTSPISNSIVAVSLHADLNRSGFEY
jgi:hypothetical protein